VKTIEFLSDNVWPQISQLARKAARRHVAVAYIPSAGFEMLKMDKGDTLVVDMSEARVRAGGTDPAVIEQYLKRGVTVHSLPSLHAKGFVLDDTAVVGSMNVSSWSRDRLTEAGILTTEPAVVDSARQFVTSLASQLDPIDLRYVARCKKLFKRCPWEPGAHIPSRKALHDWAYQVMKQVAGRVAWRPQHGHFISLSKRSGAIASAYLRLDESDTGRGAARLSLYPGDDIAQARPLYRSIDPVKLDALTRSGWSICPNLHFGGPYGRNWPPYESDPPIRLAGYINFWKRHPEQIGTRPRSELLSTLRELRRQRLIRNNARPKDLARLRRFQRFAVDPGLSLTFKWQPFRERLPDPAAFAPQVREKLNEVLGTWGDQF